DDTITPGLHGALQLEIKNSAGKRPPELGADRGRTERVCRRQTFCCSAARVAVPAVEGEPLQRREPPVHRYPFSLSRGSDRVHSRKERLIREGSECGSSAVTQLEPDPLLFPTDQPLPIGDALGLVLENRRSRHDAPGPNHTRQVKPERT